MVKGTVYSHINTKNDIKDVLKAINEKTENSEYCESYSIRIHYKNKLIYRMLIDLSDIQLLPEYVIRIKNEKERSVFILEYESLNWKLDSVHLFSKEINHGNLIEMFFEELIIWLECCKLNYREIKISIRIRDKHRCQICGANDKIEIHHIRYKIYHGLYGQDGNITKIFLYHYAKNATKMRDCNFESVKKYYKK